MSVLQESGDKNRQNLDRYRYGEGYLSYSYEFFVLFTRASRNELRWYILKDILLIPPPLL